MKCHRIRKMISPYVDDRLGPAEKEGFISHIRGCADCRKDLEETQALGHLFASAEIFHAPYGFTTRVMENLKERDPSWLSRFSAARPLFLRVMEVALVLIVFFIGLISGNVLVADKGATPRAANIQQALSLEVFQATPPDTIGAIYVTIMEVKDAT
jgi:anti-sigma factor RsiW